MAAKKRKLKPSKRAPKKAPKRNSEALHIRDVLFRPERLKYIKGQKDSKPKSSQCVFCEALKSGLTKDSLVLWKGDHTMIVMNKFPYNPGHLLVLPVQHEGDILKLSQPELTEIMLCTQSSVRVLKTVLEPSDFNIGLNLGRGAGAGIPEHLHVHIVPRWPGDTNFFPILAQTKVIPADLISIYEMLKTEFDKMELR